MAEHFWGSTFINQNNPKRQTDDPSSLFPASVAPSQNAAAGSPIDAADGEEPMETAVRPPRPRLACTRERPHHSAHRRRSPPRRSRCKETAKASSALSIWTWAARFMLARLPASRATG